MATVLLCSDEPILAEGLAAVLPQGGSIDFVSFCPVDADLPAQVELHQPSILLLDVTEGFTFGLLNGLRNILARTRIILWVHSISTELALQAMSLGVCGILRKTVSTGTVQRCLASVSEGELWFDKALTESVMSARRYSLTRREGQLVVLLTEGLKNKEIAVALCISEGTVKVYLSRLFQKLGVKDRFELAIYGFRNRVSAGEGGQTGSVQRDHAAIVNPPRSLFVERLPSPAQHIEPRALAHVRP